MNQKIYPSDSLRGTLTLPADKSISHRAALFASIAGKESNITNFSQADDPQSTLACLRQLGVPVEQRSNHSVTIKGVGRSGLHTPDKPLDCGNSGTTMRLLSGIVGGCGLEATLSGDKSLNQRPMRRIIDPLREMGVEIEARKGEYAPLQIKGRKENTSLDFTLPIASAQLKSCVLLAGLFGTDDTIVREKLQSRDHTERLLNLRIEEKEGSGRKIFSNNQVQIPEQSYRVPADFSAASFWLVAGAIHPDAEIEMTGVGLNPTRTALLDILNEMGADISVYNETNEGREPVGDLIVKSSSLKATNISSDVVPNCIDEIPILAVAMLFAEGTSVIRGAEELRHKETDRLKAIADIFTKVGASFEVFEDGLKIQGNPTFIPERARLDSYDDHRIAMSAAVLTLLGDGPSLIRNAEVAKISYPTFWEDLQTLVLTN